jgi:tetratricopeptide (TPR) repeat protein
MQQGIRTLNLSGKKHISPFAQPYAVATLHRALADAVRGVGEQLERSHQAAWEGQSLNGDHVWSRHDLLATGLIVQCVAESLAREGLGVEFNLDNEEVPLAALDPANGYPEAEAMYRRGVAICEKALGPEHPETATSLNNLAQVCRSQARYAEAEQLDRRALAICEKVLGPEHPDTATSLNNLAALYYDQGRYTEAEPLYRRALAICEKVLGPNHPNTATSLKNLANLYLSQGRYAETEPLLRTALAVHEKALGPRHPDTVTVRASLAELRRLLHSHP